MTDKTDYTKTLYTAVAMGQLFDVEDLHQAQNEAAVSCYEIDRQQASTAHKLRGLNYRSA